MNEAISVKFAKTNELAVVPYKSSENAGYDVYACFDEDYIIIEPKEVKLIPTGIASVLPEGYHMILKERGSTGTKCMAVRSGVIDNGFRGEWFVPINNTGTKPIVISKLPEYELFYRLSKEWRPTPVPYEELLIVYPYSKAICQAVLLQVPALLTEEISLDELKTYTSERGTGCLGSSGK